MFIYFQQELSQGADDVQCTILPARVSTRVHQDLVAELHHLRKNLGGTKNSHYLDWEMETCSVS